MASRVLVVDDDPDIRTFLEISLNLEGYDVATAVDGLDAVETATADPPDAILLDVMMPRLDGLAALQRLRAHPRTAHIPILLLTARAQNSDKVGGLDAGADDYITKPFDTEELCARLKSVIRRNQDLRSLNALTGMPGNAAILAELQRRMTSTTPAQQRFALLYVDLNDFKPFNDFYGFLRGDDVLLRLGRMVSARAVQDDAFAGHVGGDDFVLITSEDPAIDSAQQLCDDFDSIAAEFYDDDQATGGGIDVEDRRGTRRFFPFVSIAVGIATTAHRTYSHPQEVVETATEMKRFAKAQEVTGSRWAIDRRTS